MVNAYDFDSDNEVNHDLSDIGKKLLQVNKSKDSLIKLLKQAGEVLEKTSQTDAGAKSASKGVAKAVVNKSILDHKDKDVRTCAAKCLSHILKIHAPDSPYTTAQLQDVFGLFMWVFRRLGNPSSPSYQLTLSVLDNVSQIKCCLLMLDFDNDDMVCDLFKIMLDTVNGSNRESVEPAMLEIMASMIEEADDVSQPLLDNILECVMSPKKEEQPEAYALAQQLMHRAEDRLQRYLQRFLNNIILGSPTDSNLQEDDYHDLIYQVHLACPQTLLPVLPLLTHELQVEVEAKRLAAIDLLGKLFTLPGSGMDEEYGYLFEEFLRRCKDQKVEVRLRVIQYCKQMLGACAQASTAKVLEAVLERLQDFEDKVRSRAIATICEAAIAHPETVTLQALEAVSNRLRDKKLPVRKEAATQLAAVFRAYCNRSHDASVITSDEERVIWIPARLLVAATRDPELYSFILDTILRSGLLPSKLGAQAAARHWGIIYMSCSQQERYAVMAVLRAKARQQQDVQAFLAVRADKSSPGSPFADGHEARIAQAIRRAAASFPDSSRADEALHKIHEMRDGHIFKGLATLCAAGTSLEAAAKVTKDTVQRIGSKGFVGEFAKCLCARLSPTLVAPEHLQGLLEVAAKEAGDKQEGGYPSAVLDLLLGCAASAPALFAGMSKQVTELLDSKDTKLATAAAGILIHAAVPMLQSEDRAGGDSDLSAKLKPLLLQLCSSGAPRAAKVAIRALSKVLDEDDASVTFQSLAKKLIALLQKPSAVASPALPAALKALGALGQVAPAVFADHASSMADFVLDELLEAAVGDLSPGRAKHLKAPVEGRMGASPHQAIVLKMLGLKALATACVACGPSQPAETKQATTRVVEQLVLLVNPENDLAHVGTTGPIDEGCIRLATANALLKLAKSQDNPVNADVYMQLALTMQDPIMEVRHQFALKVHQMIQDFQKDPTKGHKAAKWAAVFPLAAMDPTQANCQSAYNFLMEFVAVRRRAVQHRVSAAAAVQSSGGTLLHEYPDFILPFIIQSLAHHPDFPTQKDLDEDDSGVLEPFQKMLQFALEPLLLYVDPVADQPGSTLPVVQKILRTLKHTEDATSQGASANIYILCDMALAMASAIAKKQQPVKGKAAPSAAASHPGNVPLPASFYRSLDLQSTGRKADGSHLPDCFKLQLTDLQLSPPAMAAQREPKGKGRGAKAGDVKGKAVKAKAGAASRKRPSDAHKEGGSTKKPRRRKQAQPESEDEESEVSDGNFGMEPLPSPKGSAPPGSPPVMSPGKKRSSVKAAPRSPASPGQLTGSSPARKGRGTKQAGRTRGRESKEERSLSEKSGGESEEDEPSAKRPNKGKAGRKHEEDGSLATDDSAGSPGKASKQPAKQKQVGKARAVSKKAEKAQLGRAQKAGAGRAKAGRKGKQAAASNNRNAGRAEDDEDGAEAVSEGQKGGRKGKAAPLNRQRQKAAAASKKAATAKPASRNKHEHSGEDEEEQSAASSDLPLSPVSVAKARPGKRGRKALSDNAAEQDDDNNDDDAEAAANSPQERKGAAVKSSGHAGRKAASKGKKEGSEGQRKEAKAKQPSTRQQPRRGVNSVTTQQPKSGANATATSTDTSPLKHRLAPRTAAAH